MYGISKYIAIILLLLSGSANSGPSHCKENEVVLFNCSIKNSEKLLSVCGNRTEYDYSKYEKASEVVKLQYRYGKPNSVELYFPVKMETPVNNFKLFNSYSKVNLHSIIELTFSISNNEYTVFSRETNTHNSKNHPEAKILGGDEQTGFQVISSGIDISTKSEKVTLLCNESDIQNNLSELSWVFHEQK